jgi:hypothetical protein
MNIEHRTSNIERPTSNNVFCQFKKKTEQAYSAEMAMKAGSDSILRDSTRLSSSQAAVRCSARSPAAEGASLIEDETSLKPNPDKPEITNYKHHLILKLDQINSKC